MATQDNELRDKIARLLKGQYELGLLHHHRRDFHSQQPRPDPFTSDPKVFDDTLPDTSISPQAPEGDRS